MRAALLASALLVLAVLPAADARADTFAVTTTFDNGDNLDAPPGSLRRAVVRANATAGPDVIDATGVSGAIELQGALPELEDDVEIRGPGPGALTVRRREGASEFRILWVLATDVHISGLTIANGRIGEGQSRGGGGILNFLGRLTLSDVVVSGNASVSTGSGGRGGGISNLGAMTPALLTLIDSTVSGNRALGTGGGIHNGGNGRVMLIRSTVSGNTSEGGDGCTGGGGIFNAGELTVDVSTVSGNAVTNPGAPEIGGGIRTCSTEPNSVAIANSTIVRNSSHSAANLSVALDGAAAELESTIVADPLGGGANCDVEEPVATLTSRGHNISDDGSCRLTAAGDQPHTEPLLGPLAGNGGLTPTHALSPESPAVDAGSGATTFDQRALPRPVDFASIANAAGGDGGDIGAYELQSLPPPPAPPPPPAAPPAPAAPRPAGPTLPLRAPGSLPRRQREALVDARGRLLVELACPPQRRSRCRIRLRGATTRAVRVGSRRTRLRVRSRTYSVRAGRHRRVAVQLSLRLRRAIGRRGLVVRLRARDNGRTTIRRVRMRKAPARVRFTCAGRLRLPVAFPTDARRVRIRVRRGRKVIARRTITRAPRGRVRRVALRLNRVERRRRRISAVVQVVGDHTVAYRQPLRRR